MQVFRASEATAQRQQASIFTGEVERTTLVDQHASAELRIGLVAFSPGGRTTWHTHTGEQGLIIARGRGIVASEASENVVEAGDVVLVAAGEKHWHGATGTTAMAHYSIMTASSETTVLEPVDRIETR
jgi:quercetin dioxygenase-like cupin family protein